MQSDKTFLLTSTNDANSQIMIDRNGNMVYINPNINYDGIRSTLNFTGKKDKTN